MIKKIKCDKCGGTGQVEAELCDICGKQEWLGDYKGQRICQQCWAEILTDEEIENL